MKTGDFNTDPNLPADIAEALRADARQRSARPEEFWMHQQTRIRARIESSRRPRPRRLLLAVAGAGLLFVAILLSAPARHAPPVTPQVAVDADQELLLAVEHALAMGTPEALEPLTLLVESNSNFHAADLNSHKEHRNED